MPVLANDGGPALPDGRASHALVCSFWVAAARQRSVSHFGVMVLERHRISCNHIGQRRPCRDQGLLIYSVIKYYIIGYIETETSSGWSENGVRDF